MVVFLSINNDLLKKWNNLCQRKAKYQINMSIKFRVLGFFVITMMLASCSPKIPFTQAIRDQYKLDAAELKHIQFYLSDPIVLRRGDNKENQKSTEEGTLIV